MGIFGELIFVSGMLGDFVRSPRDFNGFSFGPFNRPVTLTPVRCTPLGSPPPPPGESSQQRYGGEGESTKRPGNESVCVPGPANRNQFLDLCLPDSTLHIQA